MKRIVQKVLIILTLLVTIDIIIGIVGDTIISKLNENNYNGDAALLNYSLNAVESDAVIVGSSTAQCHYVPSIISDSLSKYFNKDIRVFNAGASMQGLAYDYALVKSICDRCNPKFIILDLQYQNLTNQFTEEQQSTLKSYYGFNKYITEIFDEHCDSKEKFKLKSNLYRFNTTLTRLIFSFLKPIGSDGFYEHEGTLKDVPDLINENLPEVYDQKAYKEFVDICNLCKKKQIQLVVSISPYLNHCYTNTVVKDRVANYCRENEILLVDLEADPDFQNNSLFFDQRHMNVVGARKYTNKFTRYLIEHLKSI